MSTGEFLDAVTNGNDMKEFSDLVGMTFTKISGDSVVIKFTTTDNRVFQLYHYQDCCESVLVEDIAGDINDLLNTPILQADESTKPGNVGDSSTWTFYKLVTIKGHVTIRWLGKSNGRYSEAVSFKEVEKKKRKRKQP